MDKQTGDTIHKPISQEKIPDTKYKAAGRIFGYVYFGAFSFMSIPSLFIFFIFGSMIQDKETRHQVSAVFFLVLVFLLYEGFAISIAISKKFRFKYSLFAFSPLVLATILLLVFIIIPNFMKNVRIEKQKVLDNSLVIAIGKSNLTEAKQLVIKGAKLNIPFSGFSLTKFKKDTRLFIVNNCADEGGSCYLECAIIDLGRSIRDHENNKIIENKLRLIEYLVNEGADPNFSGQNKYTPLNSAIYWIENNKIRLYLVDLLIRYGVDVNKKGRYGGTPLMNAVSVNDLDILKLLIECGADVNALNDDGNNALWYSVYMFEHPSVICIKYLIEKGINVNHKNKEGQTILFQLSESTDYKFKKNKDYATNIIETLNLLKQHGMNFNLKDNNGNTVTQYIKKKGYDSSNVISILSKYQN